MTAPRTVTRSRQDDRYDGGRATGVKIAGAGVVASIQGDTVTVTTLEEDVAGVIPLGEIPPVGTVVELEARGDLVVIPWWFETDPWTTLPDVVRVMVPAGYTTPQGVNGWSPGSSEMSLHSQRLHIYTVNGPVFNPVEVFRIPDAWACGYNHAWKADEGGPYWNTPTTRSDWVGPGLCNPLPAPYVIGTNVTTGVNGASCRASTSASGSQDALRLESRQTAFWINLAQIKTSHLGHISSPSGGLPPPVPPPGYTLVWENPTSALTKIEAAISEPTTNVNNGTVYMVKTVPGSGDYGPTDPSGASLNWTIGNPVPGQSIVPGYSGGEAPWTNVTDRINVTGLTWFMFQSRFIHDAASLGTGVHPFDVRETRLDLRGAFRFSVTPSRYRFVPV